MTKYEFDMKVKSKSSAVTQINSWSGAFKTLKFSYAGTGDSHYVDVSGKESDVVKWAAQEYTKGFSKPDLKDHLEESLNEMKSTHSESDSGDTVEAEGGSAKKNRKLDKDIGDKVAEKIKGIEHSVAPDGAIRKEDLDAMFAGSELSEDFQTKASALFEGAVSAKIVEIKESIEAESAKIVNEAIAEHYESLTESVDGFLGLVIENWMEANKVAVKSNFKSEMLESLITGISGLVAEHHIDLDDRKVDIVDALTEEVATLEESVNELAKQLIESKKTNEAMTRAKVISGLSEGLDDVNRERLNALVENISFSDEAEFTSKAKTLKESIVSVKVNDGALLNEAVAGVEEAPLATGRMADYLKMIKASK